MDLSLFRFGLFSWLLMELQDYKIIAWNIRGAMSAKGKRHVKELVRKFKLEVFIVLETHTQLNNVKSFWDNLRFSAIGMAEAMGHSGGIWVLANNNNFQVTVVDIFHQCVSVKIGFGSTHWICSAIYASPTPVTREDLWDYLKNFGASIQHPWLLIGDFNEVLFSSEVRGGNFVQTRADRFAEMMENSQLMEIGAVGH